VILDRQRYQMLIPTFLFISLNCSVFWQVVMRPQPGQEVQVELYDKDMDKDDFLGR